MMGICWLITGISIGLFVGWALRSWRFVLTAIVPTRHTRVSETHQTTDYGGE